MKRIPGRRSRGAGLSATFPALLALLALSAGAGCVGGWGNNFDSKGAVVGRAPLSALVVEGAGEGAPAAGLTAALGVFVEKAGIGVRTLTASDLAEAEPVTSNASACSLGGKVGERVIVWLSVRRRFGQAFKCLKNDVEMTPKGEVKDVCVERSQEPTGVTADVGAEVRVVDNRDEQCVEIAFARTEQRAEAETQEAATLEAERLAWEDLQPRLARAFAFDPTVKEADGDWAEIDPGRGALQKGELHNVVRDGAYVGTASIRRAGKDKKPAEARLLRGTTGMRPGDILIPGGPSASCCVEVRAFVSGASITTPAGDPRFAYGGGFHGEWYRPVSSLLFGVSLEKLVTAADTTTDFFTAHAGYQWSLWPRTLVFFGRVGGGFSTSHLDVPGAGAEGETVTANASGGHVSGILGVKLGLADALWLNAEGGYMLASDHDGWHATNAEGEPLDTPVMVPERSNVNTSGALFRASVVLRFWPY